MIPDDNYFETLAMARPMLEQYNAEFRRRFEVFLADQTADNLNMVMAARSHDMAEPSGNSYGDIHILYFICDIAVKELGIGFIPITAGTHTCDEAIDKYHTICFMKRRAELLSGDGIDGELVKEAKDYISYHNISPIALSFIINNELGGNAGKAVAFWQQAYRDAGKERDALLIAALQEK